jgi:hypothetical protein
MVVGSLGNRVKREFTWIGRMAKYFETAMSTPPPVAIAKAVVSPTDTRYAGIAPVHWMP